MTPKQQSWIVADFGSNLWYVTSLEELNGIKKASESGGGHFTSINHLYDGVVDNGTHNCSWLKFGVTVSFGASTAHSQVTGKVTTGNGSEFPVGPASTTFTFSQVYP